MAMVSMSPMRLSYINRWRFSSRQKWQLKPIFSTLLPADWSGQGRQAPWILRGSLLPAGNFQGLCSRLWPKTVFLRERINALLETFTLLSFCHHADRLLYTESGGNLA